MLDGCAAVERVKLGRLLVISCICLLVSTGTAAAFPNEDEVKARLRRDMTVEEVVAALGEPTNGRVPGCQQCTLRYLAPIGRMDVPREGYIGVSIQVRDGKVHDWQIHTGNPSYNPTMKMPSVLKWELWVLGGLLIVGWLLRLLVRRTPAAFMVYKDALAAYEARDIPLHRLPSEFHFITHDTTVEEVIARIGQPSRRTELPVDPESARGYRFLETESGRAVIVTYEYDLPYSAAVIIMPEYPFETGERVRAVFYRPLDPDLADVTGK